MRAGFDSLRRRADVRDGVAVRKALRAHRRETLSPPEGVYESELSQPYLLDDGTSEEQAANESGVHAITVKNGRFTDTWRSANGTEGFCSGTYEIDGQRVTFTWITGRFGDRSMTFSVDGDEVTWCDIETFPPHNGADDQSVAEVFNGVPWTRTGDVPGQ